MMGLQAESWHPKKWPFWLQLAFHPSCAFPTHWKWRPNFGWFLWFLDPRVCSWIRLLIHSQWIYTFLGSWLKFTASPLGTSANVSQPKIRNFSYFGLWPVQNSCGIWSPRVLLGDMLIMCTTVRSASSQKPFHSPVCCIMVTIHSWILQFIHSATPLCSGLYGVVYSRRMSRG